METVQHNTKLGGIEIRSDNGYSKTVIDWLKLNGYKWSPRNKMYYTRYSIKKLIEAENRFNKKPTVQLNKINLDSKLIASDLSVRVKNCLYAAQIETIRDLLGIYPSDILKFRNFGKASFCELTEFLTANGIQWNNETVEKIRNENFISNNLQFKKKEETPPKEIIINMDKERREASTKYINELWKAVNPEAQIQEIPQKYRIEINVVLMFNGHPVPESMFRSFTDAEMKNMLMQLFNMKVKQ